MIYEKSRLKHMLSHLVVKVCFCSALWPQPKFAIGHLVSVVPETGDGHRQYQHSSHNCHGNKGEDCSTGALGNLGYLRESPRIFPLGKTELIGVVRLIWAGQGGQRKLTYESPIFIFQLVIWEATEAAQGSLLSPLEFSLFSSFALAVKTNRKVTQIGFFVTGHDSKVRGWSRVVKT